MKKNTYIFRSLKINSIEKNITGTSNTYIEFEMDDTTIEQHTIELTLLDIFKDSAWIIGFALSLMISAAVFFLSFGGVYLMYGKTIEQSTWDLTKIIFIASGILLFLILLIFFTVKFSIQNKKKGHVEKLRGKGNWKIVDEEKWDNFYRLLMISKNSRGGHRADA